MIFLIAIIIAIGQKMFTGGTNLTKLTHKSYK